MKKFLLFISLFLIFGCSEKFTKNNAREFLEEQNLTLEDDFTILENYSDSWIGDYYHTFTLSISEKDKNRIIEEIKNSKNFKSKNESVTELLYLPKFDNSKVKIFQNYKTDENYVREFVHKPDEKYAKIFRQITISKTENKLTFQDIDL